MLSFGNLLDYVISFLIYEHFPSQVESVLVRPVPRNREKLILEPFPTTLDRTNDLNLL